MTPWRGGAKQEREAFSLEGEAGFPETQAVRVTSWLLGRLPPAVFPMWGGEGAPWETLPELGGEVHHPSLWTAAEVGFGGAYSCVFAPPTPPAVHSPVPLGPLPPWSSLCWLVTHSLLCNAARSPRRAALLRAISSPPRLCLFCRVNAFHM